MIASDANYLLFRAAPGLDGALREKGVLIRSCDNYEGLSAGWYRVAVRTHAENEALIQTIREIEKALVRKNERSLLVAQGEDMLQKPGIGEPSGGVIGVAEEEHRRSRLAEKIENPGVRRKAFLL